MLHELTDDILAAVGSAFASVGPILERNEAPFFPDYTDHGINHVESVLRTCELMVGDEAWNVFTRADAATLVLATLAHDLGMLINVEGFRYLVEPDGDDIPPLVTDDEKWQKLWREFQLDSRRFDGPTLTNILGSSEPIAIEELDSSQLTERGIRIAGEFLRRHHHRLAHEIVVLGMPTERGRLPLFDGVPQHLRELSGLVARSHGIPMRNCLDLLTKLDRTGHREYRDVHPTFLMALVRLADYLDIEIGRAPASLLAAKSLRSPISRREWWFHRAIVDCHSHDDDPECLHVVVEHSALPNVATFAVVEEKINGIQEEFDSCWAVLGEVYGRFPPLNRLSLKIRRIRSDLRELSKVSQLPFVPYRASLESARADLLKLLIEPLYGDSPGIGIRELIQNSIDAVREFDFITSKMSSSNPIDRNDLEGDVVVHFEQDDRGDYWVVVADRGIGMTWETVSKYYLTAGASFRQSDVWKRRFSDDSGTAQVLRSGRFGIGVLAAFLLGDRIRVTTRHVEEPENKGIYFEFGLDDTNIEMRWIKHKVGSIVKVRTTESIVQRLMESDSYYYHRSSERWDWFCLEKPVLVRRNINGEKVRPEYKLPGIEGPLPNNWHRIQVPGLKAVDWSYQKNIPALVCNGILVSESQPHFYFGEKFRRSGSNFQGSPHLFLSRPNVSVYDPDGRFPLNLVRGDVASEFSDFETHLVDDLCRNFIAFCLVRGPQARILSDNQFKLYSLTPYPGIKYDYYSYYYHQVPFSFLFDTPNGFGLTDPWNISHFATTTGLLIRIRNDSSFRISKLMADSLMATYGIMFAVASSGRLDSFDSWHRKLALTYSGSEALPAFIGLKMRGVRTLMPINYYERFNSKQPKFVVKSYQVHSTNPNWVILTSGDCPNTDKVLLSLAEELHSNQVLVESVSECFFLSPAKDVPMSGRIAQMWKNVIGGPIIPFNKDERERMTATLDEKFQQHLAEWKRMIRTKISTKKQGDKKTKE